MKLRCLVLALLLFVGACAQNGGPETLPATGTVTMNGEPVAGALVVFTPKSSGAGQLAAQAETNDAGQFDLQTYLGGDDYKNGVEPGEYVVTVTKLEVVQDMRRQPKHLLPKKYSLPGSSDLTATVDESSSSFQFDLK
jgi:hypothetical protein